VNSLAFSKTLGVIWELVSMVNKYIDETAPWAMAKDEGKKARLATVMEHCIESLKKISVLLAPFMPLSSEKMWEALGGEGKGKNQKIETCKEWGTIPGGTQVKKISALFPRIITENKT